MLRPATPRPQSKSTCLALQGYTHSVTSLPNRQTLRLRDYDYADPGSYFITICTDQRAQVFRDAPLKGLVEDVWRSLPEHHPHVVLDAFVVMPNHVHCILALESDGASRAQHAAPLQRSGFSERPIRPRSLPTVVRAFKSASAKAINDFRGTRGSPVWQRNYFEHITRDDRELDRIREYIANNPISWPQDPLNPDRTASAAYEKAWSWIERRPV